MTGRQTGRQPSHLMDIRMHYLTAKIVQIEDKTYKLA